MSLKEMFSKLEWESAEKLKIPENHYTDTYHLFHRRVGDFAKQKNSADQSDSKTGAK